MSLERPRPRSRSWGFSLCGLPVWVGALGAEIGVKVGTVVSYAPPDTDKGWPGHAVPPLRELSGWTENAHFRVFREVHPVTIKDVCHRLNPLCWISCDGLRIRQLPLANS